MTDLVSQLVGALNRLYVAAPTGLECNSFHHSKGEFHSHSEPCKPAAEYVEALAQARAALTAAKAGGWVAVQSEPVAWMRKWTHDGEEPQKTRNENGRMAWPLKFKFLPVTERRCLSDDVPLYAPLPNPPKEQA